MNGLKAVVMPKWGITMEEGTIVQWHLGEGASVAKGYDLVDIETSKIANTLEAESSGVLRKLVARPGDTLGCGELIAVLSDGEDVSDGDITDFIRSFKPVNVSAIDPDAPPQAAPDIPPKEAVQSAGGPSARRAALQAGVDLKEVPGSGRGGRVTKADVEKFMEADNRAGHATAATPVAARLARKLGIALEGLTGTGRHGRITVEDLERTAGRIIAPQRKRSTHADALQAAPAPRASDARGLYAPGSFDEERTSAMRQVIAQRLVASKLQAPHFYLKVHCQIDDLLRARKALNGQGAADTGQSLSVNDFVIRAAALALVEVPDVNVSWAGDAILRHKHADIAVAVALEDGLLTPIIRGADTKDVVAIGREARSLAARARSRKLQPHEIEGGTFTVSNLGMMGISEFTAVINSPQGAILAVGQAEQRLFAGEYGNVETRTVMTVTLSCDHRVIDGAVGARWLAAFKGLIEAPALLVRQ